MMKELRMKIINVNLNNKDLYMTFLKFADKCHRVPGDWRHGSKHMYSHDG